MNEVSTADWQRLCEQQLQRALGGDSKAAEWIAKHRPETETIPDDLTSLLTPNERSRFEWDITHNKLSAREALLNCTAVSCFTMFTSEELRVWLSHLEARQESDAAYPEESAERLRQALGRALERDQDPKEIKANQVDRRLDNRVWSTDG